MITQGLSPKAVLAFLFPSIASVGGVLSQYVGTGTVDTATLRAAGVGLIASGLAALGAYVGVPGKLKGSAKELGISMVPGPRGPAGPKGDTGPAGKAVLLTKQELATDEPEHQPIELGRG